MTIEEALKYFKSLPHDDPGGFSSVSFPIVRRVFGNAIANKIVSVQPMTLPVGSIFFADYVYNDKE